MMGVMEGPMVSLDICLDVHLSTSQSGIYGYVNNVFLQSIVKVMYQHRMPCDLRTSGKPVSHADTVTTTFNAQTEQR